jgi:hypothetical protein
VQADHHLSKECKEEIEMKKVLAITALSPAGTLGVTACHGGQPSAIAEPNIPGQFGVSCQRRTAS